MCNLLIALVVIVGCESESRIIPPVSVVPALSDAARRHSAMVELSRFTNFSWDHVVFLAPYTPRSAAESATGAPWPEYSAWQLERSDGFSLVVFISGGRRVRIEQVKRCEPDFAAEICARPFSRITKFRVSEESCAKLVLAAV